MSDATAVDLVLLLLRVGVGFVMFAHGFNHAFRGGRIPGAGRWFASMGMRWGLLQGWLATLTELVSGPLLALGLLTPFGAAAVIGITFVAWAIHHRKNGFFIFRPGEGYEYVMVLGLAGLAIGVLGAGQWSLDEALNIRDDLFGVRGLAIAAGLGLGGALALLAVAWRPPKPAPK